MITHNQEILVALLQRRVVYLVRSAQIADTTFRGIVSGSEETMAY
jgi:hypothetical protein